MRDEIAAKPSGARFFRADLHIHSHPASHDVTDATCTPEAIVTTAKRGGLDFIAVADHNEIDGSLRAVAAGATARFLVIPAVELSTLQGHLLCYLPTTSALQAFYGRLTILDKGKDTCHCTQSMTDCLNLLAEQQGFGVLAHVDLPKGFETNSPTSTPFKISVITHPALLGIELSAAGVEISYADSDPDAARRILGKNRLERLGSGSHLLARILNSDSHTLDRVGRNAASQTKVTRFKMNALSFEGFRVAMMECDARVRIEEHIPFTVPQVVGARLTGGFLDAQTLHFSSNLNCIIGGRGTGKSTLFHVIRCLCAYPGTPGGMLDTDVWPDEVDLLVKDAAEQFHGISRVKFGELLNADDMLNSPVPFPIECYAQGETHDIARRAKEDPSALLQYLDRFVEVGDDIDEEQKLCAQLTTLHTKIADLDVRIARIPGLQTELKATQDKIKAIDDNKGKQVIVIHQTLAQEKMVRESIVRLAIEISSSTDRQDLRESLGSIRAAADIKALKVGGTEFGAITMLADTFEKSLSDTDGTLKKSADALKKGVEEALAEWSKKANAIAGTIASQVKQLTDKGIKVNTAFFQQVTNREAQIGKQLKELNALKAVRLKTAKEYQETLANRWACRSRIATKRVAFAKIASDALKGALTDLNVSLKYDSSSHSPEGERTIIQAMDWRTNQQVRARALTADLTIQELLKTVAAKSVAPLLALKNHDGKAIFSRQEASNVIARLAEPPIRSELETCEIVDLPRLTVTRTVAHDGGQRRLVKDFTTLSFGQQQSVLLALMLSSKATIPLVIDQPEDDLDGEFIYGSIVPALRLAKERRQIIAVTHNANIAILGDAEQIIVLKSTAERATVHATGSIDDPTTRDAACNILEGHRDALKRRASIYGFVIKERSA
ncbi:TrlF family AAA-like ATPase [Reyranella sp.]|uniref:TrlF family AAA-like ATPase n=1 Tax=Reyranella sp. TaxID=1929291 RepID=UPI003D0CB0D6